MAHGWLNHLSGERVHVDSAGLKPGGVHPMAVQVMAESRHRHLRPHIRPRPTPTERCRTSRPVLLCPRRNRRLLPMLAREPGNASLWRFTMYMPPPQHPDEHLMNDRAQRRIQDSRIMPTHEHRRHNPAVWVVSGGGLRLAALWHRLIRLRTRTIPVRLCQPPSCTPVSAPILRSS